MRESSFAILSVALSIRVLYYTFMAFLQDKRILLLHPFLNFYGGAEYLLKVVATEIFPKADIYTFSYRKDILSEMGIDESRIISPLGGGIFSSMYTQTTPLYPSMMDTLSADGYDLVLSFTYGYVHGIVTAHTQPHISFVQTPMRLLWLKESEHYRYDKVPVVRELYRSILAWQRVWDRQAATRPDYLLANSHIVGKRVETFWGRNAQVVYPPVDTAFYAPSEHVTKSDYFITHSRLVRYKRIDILIDACIQQNKKLMVVGDGPDYKRLKAIAKRSSLIEFTGYVSHEEKRHLLQEAKGFLFAAEEDFGIAPVEALAAGTSVLAYGKGGVTETITADTGMFFKEQSAKSLAGSLENFETFVGHVNAGVLRKQAEKFSKKQFIDTYSATVSNKVSDFEKNGPPLLH